MGGFLHLGYRWISGRTFHVKRSLLVGNVALHQTSSITVAKQDHGVFVPLLTYAIEHDPPCVNRSNWLKIREENPPEAEIDGRYPNLFVLVILIRFRG